MEQGPGPIGPEPQFGAQPVPGAQPQAAAQPQPAAPPPRRPGRAGFWIAIIFGILLLGSAGLNMFLLLGVVIGSQKRGEFKPFTDERYSNRGARDKIAVIAVEGVINDTDEQTVFGTMLGQLSNFKGQLAAASSDPNVKAVILEVNSPGGYVTPSDEMCHLLTEFKKASGKPVVVFMKDLAASGGYYISAPADKIVAMPTSTTGSIGVIAMIVDAHKGLEDKLGVTVHIIKSGKWKDSGSPFREFTDEDRKYFEAHINSMYEKFLKVVYEGRKSKAGWSGPDDAALKEIAQGQVFSAEEALDNGLIDKIGYFEEAVKTAKSEAGLGDALVIRYRYVPPPSLFGLGGANTTNVNTGVNISVNTGVMPDKIDSPQFMYLWKP